MKIGFDSKRAFQNNTGLGNYSRYVIEAIATFEKNNQLILYAPKECDQPIISSLLTRFPNIRMFFPNVIVQKFFGSIWRTCGIPQNLNKHNIDIYHGLSNELPLNIRKFKGKSIVTIHDLIFLILPENYHYIDRLIYNIKFRRACKLSNNIIAVSECTKRDIINYYHINPDKIKVIYQGCNPQFEQKCSTDKMDKVQRLYRLPQKYMLNVGTIEERKNALTIVKAMQYLPNCLHLVLVGHEKKYAKQIHQFVVLHGLESRLHIIDNACFEDLPAIYQGAKTFIYPSVYEGFGIPILEALNSGIPVVAAKGSCLEEAGGSHSIYVNPYKEKEIAEAVLQTLIPEKRTDMINAGYQWAARFSMQQLATQTLELYQSNV